MTSGAGPLARRRAVYGALLGLVAAVVVLGPTLRRGFTLSYDMVFVPDMPITATTWGADGSVPRAVPDDLLVALLGHVLPGDIVQKLLLVLVFVLGAAGAARLPRTLLGALGCAAVYVWNPWVLERLVIGHWPYLLGLAVLPWAVVAAARLRAGEPGAAAGTAAWVVAGALCGSTSGLVVAGTAACVACWPGGSRTATAAWRRLLVVAVPALGGALVWILPAVARPGGIGSDPAGVPAFAARPDTPLGTWGSLLTLGGIWNPATWPSERHVLLLAVAALAVVVAVLVLGLPELARDRSGRAGPGLVAAGAAGLVLAVAGATPGLSWLVRQVVVHVPGGGLLRDGQKWLMPFVLLVSVCAGLAVDRLAAHRSWAPLAALVVAVPVLVLPGLAWGAHGRLGSVDYPAEWVAVQRQVAALPGDADVVSFPFTYYRRFGWNADRVVLDPVPRLLDRVVLVNDDLPLSTVTVRGEDPSAAAVRAALASPDPTAVVAVLREHGVGLALVDLTAPDAGRYRAALAGLPVLHDGPGLLLVDVGPARDPGRGPGLAVAAGVGWVLLAGTCVSVAGWRIAAARRPRLLASGHAPPGGDDDEDQ